MCSMLGKRLVIFVCLINITFGQVKYLCNNATRSGSFQITILVNKHYGERCDRATPTGTANPLGENIMEWAARTPPSSSIGLRVIDTCGSVSVNTKAMCEAVPWEKLTSGGESNKFCSARSLPENFGAITTTSLSEEDSLISTLTDANIPLLVAKDGHHQVEPQRTNAVYLGHSLTVVSQILVNLMVEMKWDFITVIYSNDSIGMESYQAFKAEADNYQICIDNAQPWKLSSSLQSINTEGVVYLGSEGMGYELLTGQNLADKTWITTLDVRGININNGRVYSVLRSEGDLLTDALAIFGEALSTTVTTESCNQGNIQRCSSTPQFKNKLLENIKIVRNRNYTYTIHDDGDINYSPAKPVTYYAYTHNTNARVVKVSIDSGVTLMPGFEEQHSLCEPQLTDCRKKCGHLNRNKNLYIHGDLMLIVSIPVHKEKNPEDRWSCTEFTTTTLFRTEAARFALNYLRREGRATIDGRSVGMVVVDSCGDNVKTAGEVYEILRGRKKICDMDGNCLNHTSVVAMVGDYSSSTTQQIQTILRKIPLIQIAYGASSIALSDREEYPYFLRTNPPDDLEAHFMVELLKKIDNKAGSTASAVSIIYSDSLYGRTGEKRVKQLLNAAGICIHLELIVSDSGSNNLQALVEQMLDEAPEVRLIITFLDYNHLINLMDVISRRENMRQWIKNGYSFIFSDTWNDDQELLDKYGEIVQGSFSFKFNADFQSTTFGDHLSKRALPTVKHENPWMSTLEQLVGNCKLPGNFLGTSSTLCETPGDVTQYQNETFTLHLMKAITAVLHGLDQIVHDDVRSDYNVLFNLSTIKSRYDRMTRTTVTKTLEGGGKKFHPFTFDTPGADTYGNGRVGYSIYNIDGKKKYVRVLQTQYQSTYSLGPFEAIPDYFLDGQITDVITSVSNRDHCHMLFTEATETESTNMPDGLTIGLAVIAGVLGLLIIIVGAFKVKHYFTKKKNGGGKGGDTLYANYGRYLSADQLKAIENLNRLKSIHLPPTEGDDQYLSLSQLDVIEHFNRFQPANPSSTVGEDNQGYDRSVEGQTTADAYVPADAKSGSNISQRTGASDATINSKRTDGMPKPAPRSVGKSEDGCSTMRSEASTSSAQLKVLVDAVTEV